MIENVAPPAPHDPEQPIASSAEVASPSEDVGLECVSAPRTLVQARVSEVVDSLQLRQFPRDLRSALTKLSHQLQEVPVERRSECAADLKGKFPLLLSITPRLNSTEIKTLMRIYDSFGLTEQGAQLRDQLPLARDSHLTLSSSFKTWHNPLSRGDLTLGEVADTLKAIAASQDDIPLIIQLVENPKYDVPGFDIFPGATDLHTHDYIHIVLGRGLLPKDEAFVIGFTMGSTDRMGSYRQGLFVYLAKNFYPKRYRFSDEEAQIFKDACKLGDISRCKSLAEVDYTQYLHLPLSEVRKQLGIEEPLLRGYYEVEAERYPKSKESQRLLR